MTLEDLIYQMQTSVEQLADQHAEDEEAVNVLEAVQDAIAPLVEWADLKAKGQAE